MIEKPKLEIPVLQLVKALVFMAILVTLFGYALDRAGHLHTGDIIYLCVSYAVLSVAIAIVTIWVHNIPDEEDDNRGTSGT